MSLGVMSAARGGIAGLVKSKIILMREYHARVHTTSSANAWL